MVKSQRVRKVVQVHLTEMERIEMGLKQWGGRAYADTLSKGLTATVLRGNKICRVHEGGISVMKEIPQAKFKVTQRTFKLKK